MAFKQRAPAAALRFACLGLLRAFHGDIAPGCRSREPPGQRFNRQPIQGAAEAFVRALSGSHSGVVGLPLNDTRLLLAASGA